MFFIIASNVGLLVDPLELQASSGRPNSPTRVHIFVVLKLGGSRIFSDISH